MLQNTGEPNVGKTHLTNRLQSCVIDITEFAAAILFEGSSFFPGCVGVSKSPDENLIDHGPFRSV